MPVLIDGNNLLFAALENDPERPPSRSTLCRLLGRWARRTGEKVAIVFDGPAPNPALARQTGNADVAVSFSGGGVSADEVLARAINAHSAPRLVLVVSSDREVARVARRRKAKTARSDAFWTAVLRDLKRPQPRSIEPAEKHRGLASDATEGWLREFGLDGGRSDADPDGT